MENVLDNPAWNALISGNSHLSCGTEQVKYFDKQVSPFAAFSENTEENFATLYHLLPHNDHVLFVAPTETSIPEPWKVVKQIKGLQMVCDTMKKQEDVQMEFTALTEYHVPQMLSLTKLTNPGPFETRTIAFGQYHGVFYNDNLVAMAGQRLHAFNYTEISAVCTHPQHIGKGYARQLLINQVNLIKAAANIPFLHVRYNNERAVKLYESLGFSTRTEVYFYVMAKK